MNSKQQYEVMMYVSERTTNEKTWIDLCIPIVGIIALLIVFGYFFVFQSTAEAQSKYSLKCNKALLKYSDSIARAQVGVTEKTGKNDGVMVERYLSSVGLKRGAPYCAAGQYFCFAEGLKKIEHNKYVKIPIVKSGLANANYNYAKKHGKRTRYIAERYDLITWRKKNSWSGHIERVIEVLKGGWVRTVAFNTSNGKRGSQREGNGVFIRKRNIFHPLGRMYIRGLVGFNSGVK